MKTDENKDIRTLDILTHEAGLAEMQDGHTTPDDRRWAREVAANMQARVAELRKSRLPRTVEIKKAAPLSERLIAMSRAALESLFGSLTETVGPRAQFAHRHLETLSDNDLRRMIQKLETHTTKG